MIKANDQYTKFVILKNLAAQKNKDQKIEELQAFAETSKFNDRFFTFKPLSEYNNQRECIDKAVILMHQGFSIYEIS